MRPRHVAVLGVLAAIPIALAVLLTGGGGQRVTTGAGAVQISLDLLGGGSTGPVATCGVTHHYTTYAPGSTIEFRGSMSSKGHWSVKLKLKACSAGTFQDSGEASARVHGGDTYKGSFPAPIDGHYFARAELKQGGAVIGRSDKRYFEVK
jgi:hypothetical protein